MVNNNMTLFDIVITIMAAGLIGWVAYGVLDYYQFKRGLARCQQD